MRAVPAVRILGVFGAYGCEYGCNLCLVRGI